MTENIQSKRFISLIDKGRTMIVSRFSPKDLGMAFGATGRIPSGGEVHRVALVRALILRPKNLILDEAFSPLPPNSEEEILSRLRELNPVMTIVVVSHRLTLLSKYSMIVKIDLEGRVECIKTSQNESKYKFELA